MSLRESVFSLQQPQPCLNPKWTARYSGLVLRIAICPGPLLTCYRLQDLKEVFKCKSQAVLLPGDADPGRKVAAYWKRIVLVVPVLVAWSF